MLSLSYSRSLSLRFFSSSLLSSVSFGSLKFLRLARRFNFPFFPSSLILGSSTIQPVLSTSSHKGFLPHWLFHHHGLSSSHLSLLRSFFLPFGLSVSLLPLRFFSNFRFDTSSSPFSGGLLLVHSSFNLSPLSFSSSPLFYFSLRLHQYLSSSSLSLPPFTSFFTSSSSSYLHLLSSPSHPLLPWDSISSDPFNLDTLNSSRSSHIYSLVPFLSQDPFSFFFSLMSSHNLSFISRFHLTPSSSSLYFDSFYSSSFSPFLFSSTILPFFDSFSFSSPFSRSFLFNF